MLEQAFQATERLANPPDGRRAYVTQQTTNSIRVIDTERNLIVGNPIPVGQRPSDVVVSPDGRRAYVSNTVSDTVSVIDTATNSTVGNQISVGRQPRQLVVSQDSARVYVAVSGADQVAVIDTQTRAVVAPAVTVANRPGGLAINPDGTRLYVTTGGLWNFTEEAVSVVDIGTGQVVGEPLHTGISNDNKRTLWDSWSGITISPDGRNAYTTDSLVQRRRRGRPRRTPGRPETDQGRQLRTGDRAQPERPLHLRGHGPGRIGHRRARLRQYAGAVLRLNRPAFTSPTGLVAGPRSGPGRNRQGISRIAR